MGALAEKYSRRDCCRVTEMLRRRGLQVNHKRIERLWCRKERRVSQKQPIRRRLWLNDGSCIRLQSTRQDHLWKDDRVHYRNVANRSKKETIRINDIEARLFGPLDLIPAWRNGKLTTVSFSCRTQVLFRCRSTPDLDRESVNPHKPGESTGSRSVNAIASGD